MVWILVFAFSSGEANSNFSLYEKHKELNKWGNTADNKEVDIIRRYNRIPVRFKVLEDVDSLKVNNCDKLKITHADKPINITI